MPNAAARNHNADEVPQLKQVTVSARAHKPPKEVAVLLRITAQIQSAAQVVPRIPQTPGLDHDVIHVDDHGDQQRQRTQVLGHRMRPEHREDAGG